MRANLRTAARRIFDPDIQLRERLFQLLSTIALAEFVFVTAYHIVLGAAPGQIAIMLAGTLLFAGTVTSTFRTKRMRLGATVSGLLYFLIYPLTFFSSGGLYGGAPVVFAFALVYVFLVTQRWERVLAMTLCIIATGVCFAMAYLHPELLTRHTVLVEHVESFLSIMLVILLLCVLFTFVTEVYRAENLIVQRQKREIEELNQAQKRFFSNMSHEIRTPVNAILGLNEMTLREDISDEVRENARGIEVASRTLLHTVNEILDMSKLESGQLEIREAPYRTTGLLSEVVGMVWTQAREKGLELLVAVDPQLPSVLEGDDVRIRQVLLNVLSNAIKYTERGSVSLRCTGVQGGDGAFVMVFDVVDTGIGIREESLPHLFDAFERFDDAKTHGIEGTGLGLSIVKQLLDMMQGQVEVTSTYGKGTIFHLTIPQRVADATPVGAVDLRAGEDEKPADVSDATELPSSDMRVLAVDDTPMNLMVVKKLLRDTGMTVDTARSGAQALEMTAEMHYDVILMDH